VEHPLDLPRSFDSVEQRVVVAPEMGNGLMRRG
jgi:hypothetical protein